jgi:hypothetical protein
MSLVFFISLLLLLTGFADLLLWPIQLLSTVHFFNWLSLSAIVLVFAWLAAE